MLHTFPPSTLAAANHRISLLYEHVIFDDIDEPDLLYGLASREVEGPQEESTAITWPATTQGTQDISRVTLGKDATFLHTSRMRSQFQTQGTQTTASFDLSDASSIANFPAFHFSLHSLTSLAALISHAQTARTPPAHKGTRKVNLLVAVLELEGPDSIHVKNGPDAGKEVTLLKMVLGDESGGVCKLTAWREVAEAWGGQQYPDPTSTQPIVIKKGDIVLLKDVLASWEHERGAVTAGAVPVTCSASPRLRSKLEVCYRALPSTPHDSRFRPDLRLGLSDAVVRKVASVVKWFEVMAGLS